MTSERIQSFEQFWPFYLGEHCQSATRWMHFFGSTAALGLTVSGLVGLIWRASPGVALDGALRVATVDGEGLIEVRLGLTWDVPL